MNSRLYVTILVGFLATRAAVACSCPPRVEPEVALTNADLVFTGTVLTSDTLSPRLKARVDRVRVRLHRWGIGSAPEFRWLPVAYELQSAHWWKGAASQQVTVFSGFVEADCGALEVGKTYLVYAQRDRSNRYFTHLCMRTAEVGDAVDDLRYLGRGTVAPRRPFIPPAMVKVALLALVAIGLGTVVARHLRRVA